MFLNKNKKFRKSRLKGLTDKWSWQTSKVSYNYAIKAMETGYLTVSQIEAARKAIQKMVRRHKRLKFVQIRVMPTLSRSRKKKGIRMGASKGGFYCYVYRAKPGALLFEIKSMVVYQLKRRLAYIMAKLPIQVSILVTRQ